MNACPHCGSRDIYIIDDNGVTDPAHTRIEIYECRACTATAQEILREKRP